MQKFLINRILLIEDFSRLNLALRDFFFFIYKYFVQRQMPELLENK